MGYSGCGHYAAFAAALEPSFEARVSPLANMNPVPSKGESLTVRATWLMFAKTVGFIFSFALPILLARRWDQDQIGLYKQVFLVVTTAITVLPLGFGMSAFYFLPREPGKRREAMLNIMLVHALIGGLACCVLFLYPSLPALIFHEPKLAVYSRLIGVTILLWMAGSFLEIVPVANEEIKVATTFIVCTQASRAVIFLTAAVMFGTVRSVIYAAIIHGSVQTVVLVCYLESRFPGFWRSFDWGLLGRQLSYSVPLQSGVLLMTMHTDLLHNYFVANRFGAALYATYSFGTLQLPLMSLVQEATNSALFTRVATLQLDHRHREVILVTARAARKLAALFFPLYALFIVVGREFIQFLFTKRYVDAWPIFAVNLTLLPLSILALDPVIRAYRSERFFLLRLRIMLVSALTLVLSIWTRQLGMAGVIAVVVFIGFMDRAAICFHFGRLLGVNREHIYLLKDIGKLALASLVAALACAAVRLFMVNSAPFTVLAVCGTVFAIVYVAAVLALRILSREEYQQIREKLANRLPASWLGAA
jgi:O-antigen/teichoic acid export membrane protein